MREPVKDLAKCKELSDNVPDNLLEQLAGMFGIKVGGNCVKSRNPSDKAQFGLCYGEQNGRFYVVVDDVLTDKIIGYIEYDSADALTSDWIFD